VLNNGLKVPSLIRVGKIATIDSELVLGELGELSNNEIVELNRGLKKLYDYPRLCLKKSRRDYLSVETQFIPLICKP